MFLSPTDHTIKDKEKQRDRDRDKKREREKDREKEQEKEMKEKRKHKLMMEMKRENGEVKIPQKGERSVNPNLQHLCLTYDLWRFECTRELQSLITCVWVHFLTCTSFPKVIIQYENIVAV